MWEDLFWHRPLSPVCRRSSEKNPLLANAVHTSPPKKDQHYEIAVSRASSHWLNERYVSIALLALIPVGIVYPCAAVDWGLAVLIPFHNHWGMHNVLKDYSHHINPMLPKPANITWLVLSFLQLAGLCYFNYNDVGICKAVSMLWDI